MFLPTTAEEVARLGWHKLDIILITGDAYLDSPFIGVAIIGKLLLDKGYKVGIIAQPEIKSEHDIKRLGEPALFWGVTAGAIDSMVANYTALKKRKKQDDFTAGGNNTARPDRASIVYTNLIRKYFKGTKPIVLGGVEASLRRIAHYDYWDDAIRRSILFDAKADILVYGMGEKAVVELAGKLRDGNDYRDIRGICYIAPECKKGFIDLPFYEAVKKDRQSFVSMFNSFYENTDPITARGLCQKQDTRYLIQNPPAEHLSVEELDGIYELDYERDVHPYCFKKGLVKALDTIKFSVTSHRGCYGECNFCSITVHQGRTVISRSEDSIIREAGKLIASKDFRGYITDIGGPTANMYGIECARKMKFGACGAAATSPDIKSGGKDKRCLYPQYCANLPINHRRQIALLQKLRRLNGIKKVFIGSGIRHDMVLEDTTSGTDYLEELVNHHISGQLKIAPEHVTPYVLDCMGKPSKEHLLAFRDLFNRLNKQSGKKQFLTYYLIAAHPGCRYKDMEELRDFIKKEIGINIEQVQIFTPLPSTYSALMYHTGQNPFNRRQLIVEKDLRGKETQKSIIVYGK
jgi:uncharacterized radical SAM protein YgiQ